MTERISISEYKSLTKRHKFGAESAWRCLNCGRAFIEKIPCCDEPKPKRFPSKREARRYDKLRQMEDQGDIHSLRLQPKYPIEIGSEFVCNVILDFHYYDSKWREVVEDSKGHDNPLSRLKRKLVKACYGIDVVLV